MYMFYGEGKVNGLSVCEIMCTYTSGVHAVMCCDIVCVSVDFH